MKLRINRLISEAGLGSRREVEDYIRTGRVRINGRRAQLSDLVSVEDTVHLDEVDLPVKELILEHVALEKVAQHEREKNDRPRSKSKATERAESQRQQSSPKSAALRKTSKNNPENKWRHRKQLELEDQAEEEQYQFRHRNTREQGVPKMRHHAPHTKPNKPRRQKR